MTPRVIDAPWIWSEWELPAPDARRPSRHPEVRDLSHQVDQLKEEFGNRDRRADEPDEQAARAKARQLAARWGVELGEEPKPSQPAELSRPTAAEEKRKALVELWVKEYGK